MAIFNMTAGSSGIKVGRNKTLIKELKIRDYTFEGVDSTPIATTPNYPDWYAFTRLGKIYIPYHQTSYPSTGVWRYDPEEETYTKLTEMTVAPGAGSTGSSSSDQHMFNKHYLYDPSTDTVHYADDYYTYNQTSPPVIRREYKFDFATATWTELTVGPFSTDQSGYDWTINSAGTIAVGNPRSSSGPYILQGNIWTQMQTTPSATGRFIYNADDELCRVSPTFSSSYPENTGLYIFDGSTWTQLYANASQLLDSQAHVVTVDNEGNIAMLGYFRDYGRESSQGGDLSYTKYAVACIFTKEAGDALRYMSLRGIGAKAETPAAAAEAFLTFQRAAISWEGNVGYLLWDYANSALTPTSGVLRLTKIKPVYELVES